MDRHSGGLPATVPARRVGTERHHGFASQARFERFAEVQTQLAFLLSDSQHDSQHDSLLIPREYRSQKTKALICSLCFCSGNSKKSRRGGSCEILQRTWAASQGTPQQAWSQPRGYDFLRILRSSLATNRSGSSDYTDNPSADLRCVQGPIGRGSPWLR